MIQKINAQTFLEDSFRNGVFVFVSDSCQFCEDYKKDLERVDSSFLFIVETVTEDEKKAVWRVLDRIGFPLTAGYLDNDLKFIERGQRFGNDFSKIVNFLKKFPKEPFSQEDLYKRQKAVSGALKVALYVFPPGCDKNSRMTALNAAKQYEELAIDVDEHPGLPEDIQFRVNALLKIADKVVIFNVYETEKYSECVTELLKRVTEDLDERKNKAIEPRSL